MSDSQIIVATLVKTARRRRCFRGLVGLWRGLFIGATLWLVSLILYKLFPLPPTVLYATGLVSALCIPVGFMVGWLKSFSLLETARWLDQKARLKERLSTALELSDAETSPNWRPLVLADAARHAVGFQPKSVLPLQLPIITRWTVLLLALGFGLGFVPEYRSQHHLEKKQQAEAIRESGRQLTDLVRRQLQDKEALLAPTRSQLQDVQELGQLFAKARLTRSEALRDLAKVTDRLNDELRSMGENPALKRLAQAARAANPAPDASPAEMQKQLQSLQQRLGEQAPDATAMQSLQQQMAEIQKAASGLNQAAGQDARDQMRALAQAMSELSQQAGEMGLNLPNLDAAIEALENGNIDQFLRELDIASLDLEQLSKMAEAMRQLEAQMADIGKDLAEQLEKGQALPAISTLNRMIKQLAQGDVDEQTLQNILDELDRAITPGSQYGQVGEHLKKAVEQLQQGNRSQSTQSLEDAAEELRRLLDQMSNCESLMAALEGLKTAQLCIGNGTSWGMSLGRSMGLQPGGQPGGGVGTWADDNNWLDEIPNTGLYDNTGLERPDLDPRGLTDRGDPTLSENLTPTRIKGQIDPRGGPMPSITLRGVSIRGTSTVEYEEAVAGAQSDARSALNQEAVPRAYRNAVRDYFDDLKD